MPPWVAAPSGTLPGVVALELVLAQTEKVAVCVTRLSAYPTGFEFEIVTMSADDQADLDPLMFHHQHLLHTEELPPELLRFGVQFPDGSRATNTAGFYHERTPPQGPVMHAGGGGGGSGSWRQSQWIWPLPARGTVTLVCEWPAMDIPVSRTDLDAQLILDAAARAQVIFSDEHLPEPPTHDEEQGWSAYSS
jgi:hypothetical protein